MAASADVGLFVRAVYLQSSYMPGNVVVIIIQDTKMWEQEIFFL
jgi:hypothetical protein